MSDLKKAEGIVAQLEQKREACVRQGTELQDERANVALDAQAMPRRAGDWTKSTTKLNVCFRG
jgi:hypothetical protein